jgi:hypothetical protein
MRTWRSKLRGERCGFGSALHFVSTLNPAHHGYLALHVLHVLHVIMAEHMLPRDSPRDRNPAVESVHTALRIEASLLAGVVGKAFVQAGARTNVEGDDI